MIRTLLVALFISAFAGTANSAVISLEQVQQLNVQSMQATTMSLVNWKVGDAQDYKVTLGFGLSGTMSKVATKEEGNAIWVKQDLKLPIMNDSSEILVDRDTGKVLKYLHNGKEEQLPDDKIEIVNTENGVIEVPAGKFKVLHVTAKSKQIQSIELWINPRDISLDGAAKLFMDQGQMKITMELTKFVKN